jgi:aldose sugar dehydrogenase
LKLTIRPILLVTTLMLNAMSVSASNEIINTELGALRVRTFAAGLEHPWGLASLPNGKLLVTERPGRLRLVSPKGFVSPPLQGVPEVVAEGQGGLLDVVLDPNYARNHHIYLSYAESGPNGTAGTAVARATLVKRTLQDVTVIFRQQPKVTGPNHFGSRLVFAADGSLFVTLGERFKFKPAQNLHTDLGKIVRIHSDGSVPSDNPFAGRTDVRPEIWSYGHRNIEGAAIHPKTGRLWTDEFGPAGGDELNIPVAGRNYGWPLVSWGTHYTGEAIPKPPSRPDLAPSIYQWTPVISPSGMSFYTGTLLPAWRGNLLLGGLSSQALVRLSLNGNKVTGEERINLGRRIRNVQQGNDGAIYLLTDEPDGEILRLSPKP